MGHHGPSGSAVAATSRNLAFLGSALQHGVDFMALNLKKKFGAHFGYASKYLNSSHIFLNALIVHTFEGAYSKCSKKYIYEGIY
jgi:hypothetical protein